MMTSLQPVNLIVVLALLSLMPLAVILLTSFVKIAVVLMMLRNALGIQQIPPNITVYSFSLILTLYVMMPAMQFAWHVFATSPNALGSFPEFIALLAEAGQPFKQFLIRNTNPENIDFFVSTTHRIWPAEIAKNVITTDFIIIIPAFIVSELTTAFQIGFLLYLPFAVIDMVVQSVLLALGMMMMSPMTISLPLKLLLFILVDGWTKLISSLVLSYA